MGTACQNTRTTAMPPHTATYSSASVSPSTAMGNQLRPLAKRARKKVAGRTERMGVSTVKTKGEEQTMAKITARRAHQRRHTTKATGMVEEWTPTTSTTTRKGEYRSGFGAATSKMTATAAAPEEIEKRTTSEAWRRRCLHLCHHRVGSGCSRRRRRGWPTKTNLLLKNSRARQARRRGAGQASAEKAEGAAMGAGAQRQLEPAGQR